ncbi:MAG: MotA/TolQ/ExbB proton channel family protein [Gammaproteobacteria bacterium]|nr:MotA/TolQ/ExbB proton channel family protein [Gammaproteobacteria bacterium]MBU1725656.1 MotA/TolQ/ExbB proton channel family protein [Gammaproteobacteria bacterium]MBU2003992.1 MotA/TolQ/ExbB proton channel family protein [Gammaproteobacteria bacterium]
MNKTPWLLCLYWLWFFGLLLMGLVLLWDNGILSVMFATDTTWLSPLMVALFLLTCLHCGYRCLFLAHQTHALQHWQAGNKPDESALMSGYLRELQAIPNAHEKQLMAELLGEQLRGQHQVGWFVTGLLIKLGLLGTVVGFVIMLGSMTQIESLDIEQVQTLMQQMTQGMKIALNTTIIGLVGSMLLGLQYLMLDRTADRLVVEAVHASERKLFAGAAYGDV